MTHPAFSVLISLALPWLTCSAAMASDAADGLRLEEVLNRLDAETTYFDQYHKHIASLPDGAFDAKILEAHFLKRCEFLLSHNGDSYAEGCKVIAYLRMAFEKRLPEASDWCERVLAIEAATADTHLEVAYLWAESARGLEGRLKEVLERYRATVTRERPTARDDAFVAGVLHGLFLEEIAGVDLLDGLRVPPDSAGIGKWGPKTVQALREIHIITDWKRREALDEASSEQRADAIVHFAADIFEGLVMTEFALPQRPPLHERWILSRCKALAVHDEPAFVASCGRWSAKHCESTRAVEALKAWTKRP